MKLITKQKKNLTVEIVIGNLKMLRQCRNEKEIFTLCLTTTKSVLNEMYFALTSYKMVYPDRIFLARRIAEYLTAEEEE